MSTPSNALNITAAGLVKFDGTAIFSGVTTTQHDVIVGAASNGLTSVGPGSAGQVLQSGGASADPAYSTATYPSTAGSSGNVLTSDGTNWTSSALPAASYDPPIGSLQYFNNAAGDAYLGSNWLKCNGASVSQATYATLYSRVGLISDFQNATFTSVSNMPAATNSIIFANNLFVAVGDGGAISTSTDSVTWTTRTSGTVSNINTVTYGNGLYLYGGVGAALANSTDAITWSALTYGVATIINALIYANGLYVGGSSGGSIRTSTDTITWTARTSNAAAGILAFAYGNSKYVWYSPNASGVGYSTDAITWTAVNIIQGTTLTNGTFFNSLFLGYASIQRVYYSTDAINWSYKISDVSLQATRTRMFNADTSMYLLSSDSVITNPRYISTSTDGLNYNTFGLNVFPTSGTNIAVGNNHLCITGNTNYTASLYTYNTATNFLLPNENNGGMLAQSNMPYNLYIKAL